MSYFSQMMGLCVQNFLAGAAGLAVGIAFIRGLARQSCATVGNFWVDLTRSLLWVLLPGALLGSLLLVWQGVPMNFHPYAVVSTLEGQPQVIAQGPVAALEIIKTWVPMAEAFSMPMALIPTKIPHADQSTGDALHCSAACGPDQHLWTNGAPTASRLAAVLG